VRIEATDRLWQVTQPLIGPMVEESLAILDDYSDEELERFTELLRRAIELQSRHAERVRAL